MHSGTYGNEAHIASWANLKFVYTFIAFQPLQEQRKALLRESFADRALWKFLLEKASLSVSHG